jgi:VCBS repeat-containing protein
VSLTINPVNDDPVALDDSYSTDQDTALVVGAIAGVLANDSDVDGGTLTASLITTVANGSLSLNADGSFEYIPNPNFNGSDSFTYQVNDGNGGTDEATVSLTINLVNDDPVALDDSYSTDEDTVLTVGAIAGVLANDSDVDGDSLSVTLVDDVDNGSLSLNADGSFEYIPNVGFSGSDSFAYQISDGNGGTDEAVATITVNPALINDIQGTPLRDTLTGTSGADRITGFEGRDILTGGAGNDLFVYQGLQDGTDIITDFTVGQDQIVLTALLDQIGYSGSNPIADQVVRFASFGGSNSFVLIDSDGPGSRRAGPVAFVEDVLVTD